MTASPCPCGRPLAVPSSATAEAPHRCACRRRFTLDAERRPRELPFRRVRALCLDLDGTVRGSRSGARFGPVAPDDVVLLPNVEPVIWRWRAAEPLVVGVTNQGVVGYGTRTEVEVEAVIDATRQLFERDPFDFVLASYAHEEGSVPGWQFRSLLRKPGYGMLVLVELRARELGLLVDWEHSLFVGDRPEDRACAEGAGVPFRWAHDFFGWKTGGPDQAR